MEECIVDSKEYKQISDDGKGFEQKEVKKDVSKGMFPVDDTKKKWQLTKEGKWN